MLKGNDGLPLRAVGMQVNFQDMGDLLLCYIYGVRSCGPVQGNQLSSHLVEMSLAGVPMDTQTVQRNGKRPCGKTKPGAKRVNEKPRKGNGLMRTTYQWSDPHCFVYHSSHGKRLGVTERMRSS